VVKSGFETPQRLGNLVHDVEAISRCAKSNAASARIARVDLETGARLRAMNITS